jgi:putative membrane protein
LPKSLSKKIWIWKNNLKRTFVGQFSYSLSIFWLYTVTLWIWHIPVLYESALSNSLVHDLQHLSFFFTSYLFWILILDPFAKKTLKPEISLVYLFVSSIHAMVLGVLMALSPRVWYEPYLKTAPLLGWDSLQDQQLAGLIMWMPAGISYLLAAIYMFAKILRPSEIASPHR